MMLGWHADDAVSHAQLDVSAGVDIKTKPTPLFLVEIAEIHGSCVIDSA